MSGAKLPHHFIRVTKGMKDDARVWLTFMEDFNGVNTFPDPDWLSDQSLELFTDSAGSSDLGCGAFYHKSWSFFKWPCSWHKTEILRDITFLELVPILLAIHTWGNDLRDKKVIFRVDNSALATILNKKTSKLDRVMCLLRELILVSMQYNIQLKAQHIAGVDNFIADAISRFQWGRFRVLEPEAKAQPDLFLPDFST
ncbi:uncharacterized protein LOC117343748 [Pecten maximus]|uniref:uncharacterized protein LOC117343748 n=1 Tax=Pecten maximus TaxID=6579 RepID=UPI001457F72A|nr:uncharacterized protein LOC117343748 [Pecten maximus]